MQPWTETPPAALPHAFSPLFIGVIGATGFGVLGLWMGLESFSPLFIGVIGATQDGIARRRQSLCFQSPIHRGDRCNEECSGRYRPRCATFSPLFIGVIGATLIEFKIAFTVKAFSPLFIGVIGATLLPTIFPQLFLIFQSPIHRGDRCNWVRLDLPPIEQETFSPLFIGVIGATRGFCSVPWLA